MAPGDYTELFFLDEAVALAAGHRPCGECRHEDHLAFKRFWCEATGTASVSAPEMDRALHPARVTRSRHQVNYLADLDGMPDGAFVMLPGVSEPLLVQGQRLLPFLGDRYGPATGRPQEAEVTVLTPRPTIEVLREGFEPRIHPSAGIVVM